MDSRDKLSEQKLQSQRQKKCHRPSNKNYNQYTIMIKTTLFILRQKKITCNLRLVQLM